LQSTSASSIEWVVNTIAVLPRQLIKISHSYRLFSGSNPVDGSSKKINEGYPTNAIAIDNLRFMPPDNFEVLKLAKLLSFTSLIDCSTR
jgi:hypothetical protein